MFSEDILTSNCKDVPQPINFPAPFPGVKLHSGIICVDCHYCCRTESSMRKHWSYSKCLNKDTKDTKLQTFFESHQIFFAVNPQLDADGPQPSLFNLYMERFQEVMSTQEQQVLPPASENEVTPLLRVMLWHEHLGPFLVDNQSEPSDNGSSSESDHNTNMASAPVYTQKKINSL